MNPNPIPFFKKIPRERLPQKTDSSIRTPIDEMVQAVLEHAPKIRHWWFSTYSILGTLLPIDQVTKLPGSYRNGPVPCSYQVLGSNQDCPRQSQYISIAAWATRRPPYMVSEFRTRYFCAECLYITMNQGLGSIMRPVFFRKSVDVEEDPEADAMFVAMERASSLQLFLQEVASYFEECDPDGLKAINERIMKLGEQK